MANPFDFSSGAVLTAAQLNQIGDFETFTPSWQNVTVGSATNSGRFAEVNEVVFWQVFFDAASDTSYGSGNLAIDMDASNLPDLDQYSTYSVSGGGWVRPQGVTIWNVHNVTVKSSPDLILPYLLVAAGSSGYNNVSAVSNSKPLSWNTSGLMYLQGWYYSA